MRTRSALGFSLILHLLMALSLAFARGGTPISPDVVMVEWIESVPGLGKDAINASPNQRQSTKPVIAAKPESRATSGLAPTQENTVPTAGEFSTEARARRMTLEESYMAGVQKALDQIKIYPPLARRLGQTGRVTLRFKVGKDGEVVNSEITGLSPHPVLNEAAKTLSTSVRFPPIPAELQRPNLEFTYLVKYELN